MPLKSLSHDHDARKCEHLLFACFYIIGSHNILWRCTYLPQQVRSFPSTEKHGTFPKFTTDCPRKTNQDTNIFWGCLPLTRKRSLPLFSQRWMALPTISPSNLLKSIQPTGMLMSTNYDGISESGERTNPKSHLLECCLQLYNNSNPSLDCLFVPSAAVQFQVKEM